MISECEWCGEPAMSEDVLCLRCWGLKSAGLGPEDIDLEDDEAE